jgi:hypothetical protein
MEREQPVYVMNAINVWIDKLKYLEAYSVSPDSNVNYATECHKRECREKIVELATEKLSELQVQEAVVSSADQKWELKKQIQHLRELINRYE